MNKRIVRNSKNVLSIALNVNIDSIGTTNNPTIFKVGAKHYHVLTDSQYCRVLNNFVEDYIDNNILAHASRTPVMNWLNIAEIRTSLQNTPFYELLNIDKSNLFKHVVIVEDNGEVRKSTEYYDRIVNKFSYTTFKDMEKVTIDEDLLLYDEIYNIYETYDTGL